MTTEDQHSPAGFYFEYPVYVVTDPAGNVMITTGPRGKFLPVFTDTETADRLLPGHAPAPDDE